MTGAPIYTILTSGASYKHFMNNHKLNAKKPTTPSFRNLSNLSYFDLYITLLSYT